MQLTDCKMVLYRPYITFAIRTVRTDRQTVYDLHWDANSCHENIPTNEMQFTDRKRPFTDCMPYLNPYGPYGSPVTWIIRIVTVRVYWTTPGQCTGMAPICIKRNLFTEKMSKSTQIKKSITELDLFDHYWLLIWLSLVISNVLWGCF